MGGPNRIRLAVVPVAPGEKQTYAVIHEYDGHDQAGNPSVQRLLVDKTSLPQRIMKALDALIKGESHLVGGRRLEKLDRDIR